MRQRPLSISVIGWLLILLGLIPIFAEIVIVTIKTSDAHDLMKNSPIPISVQYAMFLARLSAGIGILKRYNWARFLYVVETPIELILGIFMSPTQATLIPNIVFFLIISFLLFRPHVNPYFLGTLAAIDSHPAQPHPEQKKRSLRTFFSIVLFVIAGLFFSIVTMEGFDNLAPVNTKLKTMSFFTLVGLAFLCSGLALNRFQDWKRSAGRVLIGITIYNLVTYFTFAIACRSDDFRKIINIDILTVFSDYITGGAIFFAIASVGWILLKSHKTDLNRDCNP